MLRSIPRKGTEPRAGFQRRVRQGGQRVITALLLLTTGGAASPGFAAPTVRVPAEWEPQAGVWMQWPQLFERSYRPNFTEIVRVLLDYETVHIASASRREKNNAMAYLRDRGVDADRVQWHIMRYDWAWMRDNGPIWVEVGGRLGVEDWGFDGWGGGVPYWGADDGVPCRVAGVAGVPCRSTRVINERGNLEFNGAGALITSWPVHADRNPALSRARLEEIFGFAFGVDQVVWLESAPADDFTGGHVDGIARFVDPETVAVARFADREHPEAWVYDEAADIARAAGFDVVRVNVPGAIDYRGYRLDAIYMNWLVTDGAVIVNGFDHAEWDAAARRELEVLFPGRGVHVLDTREIWYWGGGVHCVTNDQPLGLGADGPGGEPAG